MRLADSPCKDCADRHVGCHGKCERYQKSVEQNVVAKATERMEKDLNSLECERSRRLSRVRH